MNEVEMQSLLNSVQAEVARRRLRGEYPPGLEEQLEEEFKQILASTHRFEEHRVTEALEQLQLLSQSLDQLTGLTEVKSRYPGVSLVHRAIRRLVARQTVGLANQTREVNEIVRRVVNILVDDLKARDDADERMILGLTKHVMDRISAIDHLMVLSRDLESRLTALEAVSN